MRSAQEALPAGSLGDEADILAFGLCGGSQPEFGGELAQFNLAVVADRKPQAGQVSLGEHVEHVGLILRAVDTALQPSSAALGADANVMARDQPVEAQPAGTVQQHVELDVPVAGNARVGRTALTVCIYVRLDHIALELGRVVEDEMVDAELLAHPAGIVHVGDGAAALVLGTAPQLQCDADHFVPLANAQGRGDRTVDAARHGNQHPAPCSGTTPLEAGFSGTMPLEAGFSGTMPLGAHRSCSTHLGTASIARSISQGSVHQPSERRSEPAAA